MLAITGTSPDHEDIVAYQLIDAVQIIDSKPAFYHRRNQSRIRTHINVRF